MFEIEVMSSFSSTELTQVFDCAVVFVGCKGFSYSDPIRLKADSLAVHGVKEKITNTNSSMFLKVKICDLICFNDYNLVLSKHIETYGGAEKTIYK